MSAGKAYGGRSKVRIADGAGPAITVDHVVPRSWDGCSAGRNLVPLIEACNTRKVDRATHAADAAWRTLDLTRAAGAAGVDVVGYAAGQSCLRWGNLLSEGDALLFLAGELGVSGGGNPGDVPPLLRLGTRPGWHR